MDEGALTIPVNYRTLFPLASKRDYQITSGSLMSDRIVCSGGRLAIKVFQHLQCSREQGFHRQLFGSHTLYIYLSSTFAINTFNNGKSHKSYPTQPLRRLQLSFSIMFECYTQKVRRTWRNSRKCGGFIVQSTTLFWDNHSWSGTAEAGAGAVVSPSSPTSQLREDRRHFLICYWCLIYVL